MHWSVKKTSVIITIWIFWLIKTFRPVFLQGFFLKFRSYALRNLPLMHFWKCLNQQIFSWRLFSLRLACASRHPHLQKQDTRVQGSYFSGLSRGKVCSCRRPKNIKVDYLRSRGVFDGFCQRKLFYKNITFSENLWTFWIWYDHCTDMRFPA